MTEEFIEDFVEGLSEEIKIGYKKQPVYDYENQIVDINEYAVSYLFDKLLKYDIEALRNREVYTKRALEIFNNMKNRYTRRFNKRFDTSKQALLFEIEYLLNKVIYEEYKLKNKAKSL